VSRAALHGEQHTVSRTHAVLPEERGHLLDPREELGKGERPSALGQEGSLAELGALLLQVICDRFHCALMFDFVPSADSASSASSTGSITSIREMRPLISSEL